MGKYLQMADKEQILASLESGWSYLRHPKEQGIAEGGWRLSQG
ncbi:MAG: hypothetical protein NTU41_11310 [Chloroflexi bacterium]|nr:hypothetical protein [Chloroflexota bacterium]